ncbi:DNA polymerase III subunit alpha [Fulvivirga sedimenti]|nr:DNA polymerase III subunit alpha [Fulvivirga sedimenti]
MLNNHTYYSFRYGTIPIRELLKMAAEKGMDTLAITDINTTAACLDFVRLSEQYGIRPVLGIDFRHGARQLYVGLARNNEGFKELNDFLSEYLHSKTPLPEAPPPLGNCFIVYPLHNIPERPLGDHEYIGVSTGDLSRFPFLPWSAQPRKTVILQPVTFRNKADFNAHRLLRAIDNNTLLSKLPKSEEGDPAHVMMNVADLEKSFAAYPEMIRNTRSVLDRCTIEFEFGDSHPHKNLQTYTGSAASDDELLLRLCEEGLRYRYPNPSPRIHERLEKELSIIREKGFVSYFLINWDITSYARSKGYFYVGRGSGANSVVAYLLRITDVDPIELDLYFERFINLYRKNPPDFDIDFSWKDREDVTQYIFSRFPHVALLATYTTFQYRAVVRELGKVFGLPSHEIDALAEGRLPGSRDEQMDYYARLILRYGKLIEGFPNHLSVHAGGILISEKPIHYYTATDLPPKGYPTTHFDMIIAEDVGLYKFDILSQRGLSKIRETLDIIGESRGPDEVPDIHDINRFKNDEPVKELLREGKAIGCFYVESPAMRMLLKKLRVDDYLGLVAASSIIRPGVAQSGMMREYILRFRYPEKRKEAHPVLMKIMPETFGVMVYQEDVIKVAHYFAGLTLAEADVLRRGMSGKFRSRVEFNKVKDKYFSNCREKGYSDEETREIWRQIESFAGYAFAKGHSASYAVESYQSLFLKAYYPLEYMVATINNFGGFYRTEFYAHEARLHGATLHPPCVNHSTMDTRLFGKEIYLGFILVKDLEQKVVHALVAEREANGLYSDMEDFVDRVPVSLEQLTLLIRIGAFLFTGKNKKELRWKAHFMLGHAKKSQPEKSLFKTPKPNFTLPELALETYEDAFDEFELLGFPLTNPFELLREPPLSMTAVRQFPELVGQQITIYGYLVTVKNTNTTNKKRMHFGTFLDHEGAFIDTVHFPPVAARYPFRGRGIYSLTGKVVEEFEYYTLEVERMEKAIFIDDPRYAG